MTEPGDVERTRDRLLEFDDARIGFTHAPTWEAMPAARRGAIKADASAFAFPGTHPRVAACIKALCILGVQDPVVTHRFSEHPDAKLRIINDIEWGPEVTLKVRGVCWFVRNGQAVIPLLQPRKKPLSDEGSALYLALGRQAYCKGDWYQAGTELVDLSGDDEVYARVLDERDVGYLTDERIAEFVQTYVQAKILADAVREARPKRPPKPKGDDLFTPK